MLTFLGLSFLVYRLEARLPAWPRLCNLSSRSSGVTNEQWAPLCTSDHTLASPPQATLSLSSLDGSFCAPFLPHQICVLLPWGEKVAPTPWGLQDPYWKGKVGLLHEQSGEIVTSSAVWRNGNRHQVKMPLGSPLYLRDTGGSCQRGSSVFWGGDLGRKQIGIMGRKDPMLGDRTDVSAMLSAGCVILGKFLSLSGQNRE